MNHGPARYAAAMSMHPDAAVAVGEVVGEVLERLGEKPDVSVLFVSDSHAADVELIHGAVRRLLGGSLVGCTSSSIVGGAREVENAAAISLWAAVIDDATPVRVSMDSEAGPQLDPDVLDVLEDGEGTTLLLMADPYTFPVDDALDRLRQVAPGLQVIGGMASPSRGPGTTRLFLDDAVERDGAVGLLVGGDRVVSVVSQGCRPIGVPMVVTSSAGNVISELAGQPALRRLEALFAGLEEDEKQLVNSGLHLGRVVDERLATFDRGDFLIRGVLGADPDAGTLVVGDEVAVGDTVQFQIRDAASARVDLRLGLWDAGDAAGALLFTCNGRGQNLFIEPDHDAAAINERLGIDAVAGMFCAGEIGPVADRSFVHGFTASIAFFRRD